MCLNSLPNSFYSTVIMAKTRQTNFSQEESSIILTEFENEMEYLNSGFSNQVTNEGKKTRWDEIAKKVTAVGVALRTGDQCKAKWKSMKIEAKKAFQKQVKARNQTGGGPPPKDLKPSTLRIINLMKDHASFKGVDGGLDMFTDDNDGNPYVEVGMESDVEGQDTLEDEENVSFSLSSCPGSSIQTVNTTAIGIDTSPSHHRQQEQETSVDPASTDSNPSAQGNESKKRKHSDSLTVSDRQVKVLKGEEEIQQLKRDNLRLMKQKLQIKVEVANLHKKKL